MNRIYLKYLKRIMDFTGALIGMIVFFPGMVFISIMVRKNLGSPVFFRQERAGLKGKSFYLYKFRTMSEEKDSSGQLLPDEVRLGSFGQRLRASSLDELPSLWNVMKGDLSLVGPRPLPVCYLPYYSKRERHRHDLRPGITGLAQVNGRNYVTWEEKFSMDLKYIKRASFVLDMRILLKTIIVVLKHENIETGSSIVHNGHLYRPLDVERKE